MFLLAVALSLAPGCHWLFPLDSVDPPPPHLDGPVDGRSRDDGRPDQAGREGAATEGQFADVVATDLPQAILDAGSDAAAADLAQDASDATGDIGPIATCGPLGAPAVVYPGGTMAICQTSAPSVTQCTAATLCGPAWHLCTASEYLARGGATMASSHGAWLQSCIRDSDPVTAPTDGFCADCEVSSASEAPGAWECSSSFVYPLLTRRVGVVTNSSCFRVGIDDPANQAFWSPLSANVHTTAAVCCAP